MHDGCSAMSSFFTRETRCRDPRFQWHVTRDYTTRNRPRYARWIGKIIESLQTVQPAAISRRKTRKKLKTRRRRAACELSERINETEDSEGELRGNVLSRRLCAAMWARPHRVYSASLSCTCASPSPFSSPSPLLDSGSASEPDPRRKDKDYFHAFAVHAMLSLFSIFSL